MKYPTPRRWAAVASVAAALLALSACGGGDDPSPNPTDSGSGELGGAPSSSADPTADASSTTSGSGGGGGGGGGGNQGPSYPGDAKNYGLEILKAIGNKDDTRLGSLADANTVSYSHTQNYQNQNAMWTNTDCADNGATATCHYYNQTGEIATVTVTRAKLGQAGAGISVYLEGGPFPTDPGTYVQNFLYAWTYDGSYPKMVALSSFNIADHFNGVQKFNSGGGGISASPPHPCASNSSKTCVDADAVGGTLNIPTQHFIVDTGKISAGKPNGITGYES